MSSVTLMVPKSILKKTEECISAEKLDVNIEVYQKLEKKQLQRINNEKLLIFADAKKFFDVVGQNKKFVKNLDGLGQLYLLADEKDISNYDFPVQRGIDVIDKDSGNSYLSFKIKKAIERVKYEEEIVTIRTYESRLDGLNEIGLALSQEKDLQNLLDLIVSKSRQMTWADAGSLYLTEKDSSIPEKSDDYFFDKKMRFQVSQNDSVKVPFQSLIHDITKKSIFGYVAITQETLNLEDVYHIPENTEYGWGGRNSTQSMVIVPCPC